MQPRPRPLPEGIWFLLCLLGFKWHCSGIEASEDSKQVHCIVFATFQLLAQKAWIQRGSLPRYLNRENHHKCFRKSMSVVPQWAEHGVNLWELKTRYRYPIYHPGPIKEAQPESLLLGVNGLPFALSVHALEVGLCRAGYKRPSHLLLSVSTRHKTQHLCKPLWLGSVVKPEYDPWNMEYQDVSNHRPSNKRNSRQLINSCEHTLKRCSNPSVLSFSLFVPPVSHFRQNRLPAPPICEEISLYIGWSQHIMYVHRFTMCVSNKTRVYWIPYTSGTVN